MTIGTNNAAGKNETTINAEDAVAKMRREMAEYDARTIGHRGYTIAALKAAFAKVQNPEGWKLAIDARVPAEDEHLTTAAVEFMVGGKCRVTVDAVGARIRNAGYYANIGA